MRTKHLTWAILLVFVLALAVCGCSTARRPAPQGETPGNNTALPADPRESSDLADKLANRAAAVPGVDDAVVVLFGTTAYLGLNMESGQEGNTKQIEKDAALRVKKADERVRRVMVTSDPDLVTRLENMARGIRDGRPVDAFADELGTLNKRMTPITR